MAKNSNTTSSAPSDPFASGDFDAILDRSTEHVKEPGLVPSGPWRLRMTGFYVQKFTDEEREENPDLPLGSISFFHTPVEPLDGVDPELVEAGDWRGKRISTRRQIKEQGDDAQILKLVGMHGVDTENREGGLRACLNAAKGHTIRATVSKYSYDRRDTGETMTNNQLKSFVPDED